jgi:enterobacterial common antigen flippase
MGVGPHDGSTLDALLVKAILRATAVLSSSAILKIGIGVITLKAWALLVGPAGVGMLGLLQSLVGIGAILAGVGVGTGIVRLGARALGAGDTIRAAALNRAAIRISWITGAIAVGAFFILSGPLSHWLLGSAAPSLDVVLMGAAVCLTVVASAETGVLNAHHRVGALARSTVVGSFIGAVLGIGLVWHLGEQGIAWAVLGMAAAGWAAAHFYLRREIGRVAAPAAAQVRLAVRDLLGFGAPLVLSSLVGTGVLFVLPILILWMLDVESVGLYRAAVSISFGYLGFLLVAMAQDYYPRVAAIGSDADALRRAINEQLQLLLLLGGPLVVVAIATAPLIVPLFFSSDFAAATPVLEWQLLGSLFRFWAWAFAYVILARSSSLKFFLVEAAAGSSMLLFTWLAVYRLGLVGAGVGFLASYVLYSALVWAIVRRDTGVSIEVSNLALMAGLAVVAALLVVVPHTPAAPFRWLIALCSAAVVTGACVYLLLRVVRGGPPRESRVLSGASV